jgi:iron complex transport system substrate-binding protein
VTRQILAALAFILVTGCAKEPLGKQPAPVQQGFPVRWEARDNNGTVFAESLNAPPQRVITGTPSAAELLFELGLGDRIIGMTALDNEPPPRWADAYAAIPIIGDKKTLSREIFIGADPDLIIGRSFAFTEDAFGAIGGLNKFGIQVYTQIASYMDTEQSLESVIADVRNIGRLFDVTDRAETYAAELETRLRQVSEKVSRTPAGGKKARVVIMANFSDGTFSVFGGNASLQSALLETLGAANSMNTGAAGLSLENLAAAAPDAIIYITAKRNADRDAAAADSLLNEPALASVPAIANKRIISIPYDDFMGYGTRIFDTLETLSDFLYNL